jgi:hypothetical protein
MGATSGWDALAGAVLGYKPQFQYKQPSSDDAVTRSYFAPLAMLLHTGSFHVLRSAAGPQRLGVPDTVVLARGFSLT